MLCVRACVGRESGCVGDEDLLVCRMSAISDSQEAEACAEHGIDVCKAASHCVACAESEPELEPEKPMRRVAAKKKRPAAPRKKATMDSLMGEDADFSSQ